MRYSKFTLLTVLFFLSLQLHAQTNVGVEFSGTLNYSLFKVKDSQGNVISNGGMRFSGPLVGLTFVNKKGNLHKFRAGDFGFGIGPTVASSSGKQGWRANGRFEYEYDVLLRRDKTKPFQPYVGVFAGTNILAQKNVPSPFSGNPMSGYSQALYAGIAPGFRYQTKKRLYFDVSMPITVGSVAYSSVKEVQPMMPPGTVSSGTVSSSNLHSFVRPSVGFRLGIGFWSKKE